MLSKFSGPGPRGALRVTVGALGAAAGATVAYLAPDIPSELWALWGGVFMAAIGLFEAVVDSQQEEPDDGTP